MYAVDDLSDAIDVTREFLTPLRIGMVLKLALIVFFVSSLGFMGPGLPMGDIGMVTDDPGQSDIDEDFQEQYEAETGEEFPMEELIAGLLVITIVLGGIWLIYAFIKAIMEFVFIESLRSDEVHLRRYFRESLGRGFRLFLFRVGVVLLLILLMAGPLYFVATSAGGINQVPGSTIGAFVIYGLVITLVYSVVMRFTSEFVAPVMLLEKRGVLSAWRRFLSTFKANWTEYVVYLLLAWIILLVITITAWFVIGIATLVLAIPFGILLVILAAVLAEFGALAAVVFAFIFLFALLMFVLVLSLVWTPITAYFQYYALLLLGDTDRELDLVPDQRAALRGDAAGAATGAAPSSEWDDRDWDDNDDGYSDGDENGDEEGPTAADAEEFGGEDEFDWYDSQGSDSESEPESDTGIDERRDDSTDSDDDLDDRGW